MFQYYMINRELEDYLELSVASWMAFLADKTYWVHHKMDQVVIAKNGEMWPDYNPQNPGVVRNLEKDTMTTLRVYAGRIRHITSDVADSFLPVSPLKEQLVSWLKKAQEAHEENKKYEKARFEITGKECRNFLADKDFWDKAIRQKVDIYINNIPLHQAEDALGVDILDHLVIPDSAAVLFVGGSLHRSTITRSKDGKSETKIERVTPFIKELRNWVKNQLGEDVHDDWRFKEDES